MRQLGISRRIGAQVNSSDFVEVLRPSPCVETGNEFVRVYLCKNMLDRCRIHMKSLNWVNLRSRRLLDWLKLMKGASANPLSICFHSFRAQSKNFK